MPGRDEPRVQSRAEAAPRAGSLPPTIAGRLGPARHATASHSRGRSDRARRRLLWPCGVIRLREGALRDLAPRRRTTALSRDPRGGPSDGHRRAGLLVPVADRALHGPQGGASGDVAAVIAALQRCVGRQRRDLLAAPVDELLEPAGQHEVAVLVEHPLVAGAEIAAPEGRRVRFGVVEVAAHDIDAADRDLALLAGRQRLALVIAN